MSVDLELEAMRSFKLREGTQEPVAPLPVAPASSWEPVTADTLLMAGEQVRFQGGDGEYVVAGWTTDAEQAGTLAVHLAGAHLETFTLARDEGFYARRPEVRRWFPWEGHRP